MEDKIRAFILENYLFTDDPSALANEDSLLRMGVVDSTGVLEIIYFLEDEFAIRVEEYEMVPENLDSVANILSFVAGKTP